MQIQPDRTNVTKHVKSTSSQVQGLSRHVTAYPAFFTVFRSNRRCTDCIDNLVPFVYITVLACRKFIIKITNKCQIKQYILVPRWLYLCSSGFDSCNLSLGRISAIGCPYLGNTAPELHSLMLNFQHICNVLWPLSFLCVTSATSCT